MSLCSQPRQFFGLSFEKIILSSVSSLSFGLDFGGILLFGSCSDLLLLGLKVGYERFLFPLDLRLGLVSFLVYDLALDAVLINVGLSHVDSGFLGLLALHELITTLKDLSLSIVVINVERKDA